MPFFDRPPVHDFPDRAFRDALEQIANLRDVLVEAVPDIASHLVFAQAQYIKPAFLLEDWRGRESDLLCLIPYRVSDTTEEMVLICILLEHQSRPNPLMPLRVLLYAVLFWDLAARTPEQLLASDGPFAQFLAIVRAEQSDAERFQQIFTQLAEQLEPLAGPDKMRWRDLL